MTAASVSSNESSPNSPRAPRATSELGWLIAGQVLSVAGALVAVRCLTEVLPPDVYGTLGLAMTAATLLQQLWTGPLCATAIRFFVPAREAGQVGVFFRALFRLLTLTGAPLLLGLTALSVVLVIVGHGGWATLLGFAWGYAVASGANSLLDGVQNASRCRHLSAMHTSASVWLRLALAVGLVWACGPSASAVLAGYVGGSALVLVSQVVTFRRIVRPASRREADAVQVPSSVWYERMSAYLWPTLSWVAFTWAFSASDRWFLQAFSSTEAVGRYLVLFQLGYYPVSLLSELVQQWLYPIFFAQAGAGTDPQRNEQVVKSGRRWLAVVAGAVVVAVVCASVGHAVVFQCLAAAKYRDVSALLPGMMLASGLFALGQVAALPLLSTAGSRVLAPCKIVTSCLGLLFNAAGAWWGEVAGIVVAQIAFSTVYALWTFVLLEAQARRWARAAGCHSIQVVTKQAA